MAAVNNDEDALEFLSDELRAKLNNLNLVVEALKDAKVLEGKMNGTTAKLWRDFMGDTGGDAERALPLWVFESEAGTRNKDSSQSGEDNSTNSSTP